MIDFKWIQERMKEKKRYLPNWTGLMAGIVMDSQQLSGDEKIFIKGYLNPLYPSEECVTHEPVVFYIREKNPAKRAFPNP